MQDLLDLIAESESADEELISETIEESSEEENAAGCPTLSLPTLFLLLLAIFWY